MSGFRALVGSLLAILGLGAFAAGITGIAWSDRIGAGKLVGSRPLKDCVRDCTLHNVYHNGNHVLAYAVGSSSVMLILASIVICIFAAMVWCDEV